MARPSGLWLRKRDQMWMTTVNGAQHKLSKDKAEARRLLHQLLSGDRLASPGRTGMTTRKLCDLYLERTREDKSERCHEVQVQHFTAFCKAHGHREPSTLKVHHVEEWLASMNTWAKSTRALFITFIKAAFNFGTAQGYLGQNPLKGLKRRSTGRRHRVLTPDERTKILGEGNEQFRDFMALLDQTGCRPFSEGARITAADVDFDKGKVVLARHKNAKKTGRPRVIYPPPALLDRMKELAALWPTGALYRNRLGNPWTPDTVGKYVKRVCQRLGIEGVSSYTIRHDFLSNALANGVPVEVLAKIAGNTPKVIWSNYDQTDKMDEVLKAAARKARG